MMRVPPEAEIIPALVLERLHGGALLFAPARREAPGVAQIVVVRLARAVRRAQHA